MKTRKVLSLLVAIALVLSLCTPALAEDAKKPVFVLTSDEISAFIAAPDDHAFLIRAGDVTLSNADGSLKVSGRTANWQGIDLKKGAFTEGVEYTFIVEVHTDGTAYFQAGEGGGAYKRHDYTAAIAEATLTFKLSTFGQNIRLNTLDDSNKEDFYIDSIVIWEGEPGELPVEEPPVEEPPVEEPPVEEPAEPSLENFVKSGTANSFADPDGLPVWATADIDAVWQYGLMKGYTEAAGTVFKPDAEVTVAEVIAVVARMHCIYVSGKDTLVQGVPWFKVYEEYCADNDLIDAAYMTDEKRNQPATRAEVAHMLSTVLTLFNPEVKNNLIVGAYFNDVNDITPHFPAIGLLLSAGITTGSDGFNFKPNDPVKRSECAAFYVRMIDPTARKTAPEKPAE